MGLIKFILTHDTRVSLKKIGKMADKIMEMSPTYEAMTDDELKNQTNVLKERLANGETLDKILPELKERGYVLVTPSKLFGIKGLKEIPLGININNVNEFV